MEMHEFFQDSVISLACMCDCKVHPDSQRAKEDRVGMLGMCFGAVKPAWHHIFAAGFSIATLLCAGCGTDGAFKHTSVGSSGGLHPQQDAPHKCGYPHVKSSDIPRPALWFLGTLRQTHIK